MPPLNPTWLLRARKLNPILQGELGWVVPSGWPSDTDSAEFAQAVADFQASMGLVSDGVLGVKTAAALSAGAPLSPKPVDYLVVSGKQISVSFPVVTWMDPLGLSFYGETLKHSWQPRLDPKRVNLFVVHWDGCTSSHQCYQTLVERNLSVHLMLDSDGTVYQALDLASARAFHARGVNDRSVGVEVANPVEVTRNRYCKPPRPVIIDAGVNGASSRAHLDFYDVQKTRLIQLADAVSKIFNIPRRLPRGQKGRVIRDSLGAELVNFAGTVGHYHVTDNKDDPGYTLWNHFETAGWT